MRTQVAIVGAGPAGLLLSEMLHREGIDSVVVERQSRAHVLGRIRAGVLEPTTVQVLRDLGLAERMDRDGHPHDGMKIVWGGREAFFIDVHRHLGVRFMAWGQTALQEVLDEAIQARGATVLHEAQDVALHGLDGDAPAVTCTVDGTPVRIDADFVAGCDGFHGACRQAMPARVRTELEKVYPFGWLGVLANTAPLPEIVYAHHPEGFALASMRNPSLARFYVQVPLDTRIEDWSDERFWEALIPRFPTEMAAAIRPGPVVEKSIAPLRSFVCEPMQWGRLFLAGDAAHIVPPTGAKGLNLAVSDAFYLARALARFYARGDESALTGYGAMALRRVRSSVRTSWYLTHLLHRFPEASPFDLRAQAYELEHLRSSPAAQRALAESYAGLPYEQLEP